jgi:hypothetical protein
MFIIPFYAIPQRKPRRSDPAIQRSADPLARRRPRANINPSRLQSDAENYHGAPALALVPSRTFFPL